MWGMIFGLELVLSVPVAYSCAHLGAAEKVESVKGSRCEVGCQLDRGMMGVRL